MKAKTFFFCLDEWIENRPRTEWVCEWTLAPPKLNWIEYGKANKDSTHVGSSKCSMETNVLQKILLNYSYALSFISLLKIEAQFSRANDSRDRMFITISPRSLLATRRPVLVSFKVRVQTYLHVKIAASHNLTVLSIGRNVLQTVEGTHCYPESYSPGLFPMESRRRVCSYRGLILAEREIKAPGERCNENRNPPRAWNWMLGGVVVWMKVGECGWESFGEVRE